MNSNKGGREATQDILCPIRQQTDWCFLLNDGAVVYVQNISPPYGRQAIRLKRRSIIVDSTHQCEFLSDTTGKRRVWVSPDYDSLFEPEVVQLAQPPEEVSHEVSPTSEPLETGRLDHWDNLDSLDHENTETSERNGYQLKTVIPPPHSQEKTISLLDKDSIDETERRDSNGT